MYDILHNKWDAVKLKRDRVFSRDSADRGGRAQGTGRSCRLLSNAHVETCGPLIDLMNTTGTEIARRLTHLVESLDFELRGGEYLPKRSGNLLT